MTTVIVAGAIAFVVLFVVLPSILIIVTEYERAVFFRLGHAGHGPPGRGRAGAAGQGHRRHGRAGTSSFKLRAYSAET